MKKSRLTEKKMANKHFKKTEQAILIAYYKFREYPIAKKIAKSAHISRATLYRHHQTAINIPHDYEEYLLQIYEKRIKKFIQKLPLKKLFLRTLVFITSNREVFSVLFKEERKGIIKKMLGIIKPSIISEWKIGGDLDKIFNIYENEILGVIEFWSEENFSNQSLNRALNDVLYLTTIARKTLLPLK